MPSASISPQASLTPEPAEDPTSEPTSEPTQAPTESPESPELTPEPPAVQTDSPSSVPPQTEPDSEALLSPTDDMGQEYIDKIIFLGDSTTYGLKYYAVLSGGKETQQVWTPASGTLTLSQQGFATIVYPPTGEEIPIRDAVERAKPEMMVITLGVNGVSFMDEEYFKSEYTDLVNDIREISPDTKIILQSIFPIASNYEYQGDINNTKISAANGWVLSVAEETGVKYLNTYSVLIGSDGYMPQEYHNGDGLHLNTDSFNLVLNYIRTHGYT
jgi:lysophospholipase L1-like esterase